MRNRIEFTVPIRTISEANSRDHWRVRNARKKAQQEEVAVAMHNALHGAGIALPCSVRLVRYGQKALDTDNLAGSFKHAQDAIARKLGIDDGDASKVKWLYEQQPTGKREYFVRVEILSL